METFKLTISDLWDGQNKSTRTAALLILEFKDIEIRANKLEWIRKEIATVIEKEIQQLADKKFPIRAIKIKCDEIESRVLIITISLTAVKLGMGMWMKSEMERIPVAVFTIFRDYDKFRKDIVDFADDVKSISDKLYLIIDAML